MSQTSSLVQGEGGYPFLPLDLPAPTSLLDQAESRRVKTQASLAPAEQAQRGQYFTPLEVAQLMAGLADFPEQSAVQILDPGAGSGILSVALVSHLLAQKPDLKISLTVVENDTALHPALLKSLRELEKLGSVKTLLVGQNFLEWALDTDPRFDLVIQNPPYAKLSSQDQSQKLLRSRGITVPNIYAAFMLLGLNLLRDGGQQISITPRSWMNGSYYAKFRQDFTARAGLETIHVFESRDRVFADSEVLQEALIVSARKGIFPDQIRLTSSQDQHALSVSRTVPYTDVVTPDFIYLPATDRDAEAVSWMHRYASSHLEDLGLRISTGKVVGFRAKELLSQTYLPGAYPLLQAAHLSGGEVQHPGETGKKPSWYIGLTEEDKKALLPAGTYVLLKRFSTKEEKRRLVAAVWSSDTPSAFDNKLNYIHQAGKGLDPELAQGLALYLNSGQADNYFRVFSGHTQVNAGDMKKLLFPSLDQLRALGRTSCKSQDEIDSAVEKILSKEGKD